MLSGAFGAESKRGWNMSIIQFAIVSGERQSYLEFRLYKCVIILYSNSTAWKSFKTFSVRFSERRTEITMLRCVFFRETACYCAVFFQLLKPKIPFCTVQTPYQHLTTIASQYLSKRGVFFKNKIFLSPFKSFFHLFQKFMELETGASA